MTEVLNPIEDYQIATTGDYSRFDTRSDITTAMPTRANRLLLTPSGRSRKLKPEDHQQEIVTNIGCAIPDDDLDESTVWLKASLIRAIRLNELLRRHCDATIDAIKNLPSDWGAQDIERPNETAVANAKWVLGELLSQGLPPRHVEPSTGEGICISFLRGIEYADIECFNSGDIISSISPSNTSSEFWDIRDLGLSESVQRIKVFITGE